MDFSKIDETRPDSPGDEEQMVFHYSREERLRHAPKIVQDYYSGDFKPYKGGLFKSLVSTRGNKLLLVTIVFTFGIILFVNYFGPQKSGATIAGVEARLSAFSYGDSVYVSLLLKDAPRKKKGEFADGIPVTVTFSVYDKENGLVREEKVIGKYEGNEVFLRTTFTDFDIIKVGAVCSMRESLAAMESAVEKR